MTTVSINQSGHNQWTIKVFHWPEFIIGMVTERQIILYYRIKIKGNLDSENIIIQLCSKIKRKIKYK